MTEPLRHRLRGSLRVALGAAGVVWIAHFAIVYLVAEWLCRHHPDGRAEPGAGFTLSVTVVTVIAVAAILGLARSGAAGSVSSPPPPERRLMAWTLAAIFSLATVVVGVIPLALEPC